jgi:hypothetical protein
MKVQVCEMFTTIPNFKGVPTYSDISLHLKEASDTRMVVGQQLKEAA